MKSKILRTLAALLLLLCVIPLQGCFEEEGGYGYGPGYGGYGGYGYPSYAYSEPWYGPSYGYGYGHPWYHHDRGDWGHSGWGHGGGWHHDDHGGFAHSGGGHEHGGHDFAHSREHGDHHRG
jgi:hypothetical protein